MADNENVETYGGPMPRAELEHRLRVVAELVEHPGWKLFDAIQVQQTLVQQMALFDAKDAWSAARAQGALSVLKLFLHWPERTVGDLRALLAPPKTPSE